MRTSSVRTTRGGKRMDDTVERKQEPNSEIEYKKLMRRMLEALVQSDVWCRQGAPLLSNASALGQAPTTTGALAVAVAGKLALASWGATEQLP